MLNAFIINISLPALTLLYVHELPIDGSRAYPTAMARVLFGLGMIFFVALGRAAGSSREEGAPPLSTFPAQFLRHPCFC